MTLKSFNPATDALVGEYPETSPVEVTQAIEDADRAQREWTQVSIETRATFMQKAAERLRAHADQYAILMAEEMGKPVAQGKAEAEKCAWVCEYYAEHAASFLRSEPAMTDARRSFVMFRPLGVVLAVMPWNFPFWQVFRFAAPALMAGNAGVLKHASNVCGCALAIEAIFRDTGFPPGLFRAVLIPSSRVADVIRDEHVRAVTLTGSTQAGRAVAAVAGAEIKKTVLELGGSDPYVVLEDADLDLTVGTCVTARLINGGQSCIAAKRFIVVDAVRSEFEERFVAEMQRRRMGDPLTDVDLGPQARHALREELHAQVTRSLEQGARLALGGTIPGGPGAFYPPTVLTHVEPGMRVFDEETFGPVAAIVAARDEDDALRLANHSAFGLGAAVFTGDVQRGERLAAEVLEAGCCFVNAFVKSDPRLPFGGIKASGYGRELGQFGLREFVNVKSVYVA